MDARQYHREQVIEGFRSTYSQPDKLRELCEGCGDGCPGCPIADQIIRLEPLGTCMDEITMLLEGKRVANAWAQMSVSYVTTILQAQPTIFFTASIPQPDGHIKLTKATISLHAFRELVDLSTWLDGNLT